MSFAAKVVCDSVCPRGVRLTTFEVTFPRIVLAEFNTHRMLSRNSASSRAIPVDKRILAIQESPFVPESFGRNQKGMQAFTQLEGEEAEAAKTAWLETRDACIVGAKKLAAIEVHKQLANRVIENFSWQTCIVTATEWDNLYALRCHAAAQGEIRTAVEMMRDAQRASTPTTLALGEWHLPLIENIDWDATSASLEDLIKVSVGRCARVSTLTHDGRRDLAADIKLAEALATNGHMSPFEHPARPMDAFEHLAYRTYRVVGEGDARTAVEAGSFAGNFRGWIQARKQIRHEHNFGLLTS